MLLNLKDLVERYNLDIQGVIHCGAHKAEEVKDYQELSIKSVVWIEANKELIPIIKKRIPKNHHVINVAIADHPQYVDFYYTNKTASSSLLKPHNNLKNNKGLAVDRVDKIYADCLDDIMTLQGFIDSEVRYNLINLDIQGGELKALRGAKNLLKSTIDYVYTEVHVTETYKDCPNIADIDKLLDAYGFQRAMAKINKYGWGDAFYIKH